ncbi:hypothetical protein JCM10213_008148 [Rhodosporidiobolus nylandii]
MSAPKNDAQIIQENAASLNAKATASYKTPRSELSDTTGVTDTGLGEFRDYSPNVEVGRTGRTGGGENMRIPPEEGGDDRTEGTHVAEFDNVPAGEDAASWKAKTQPGSINVSGQAQEALRSNTAPRDGQPQLDEQ